MKKEIFSIRKTRLGVVSALLGLVVLTGTGQTVQAENLTPVQGQTVTDEQVAKAAEEVAVATAKAQETQEAVDAQKEVVDQAQAETNAAQTEVNDIKSDLKEQVAEVQDAQTEQVAANAQVTVKEVAAEGAATVAEDAKEALEAKEAEVATNLAQLESAAAQEAATPATPNVSTSTVHTSTHERLVEDNGTAEKAPITFADGRTDVHIYLTEQQAADLETKGVYDYTPDSVEVTKHVVDYINELKRLNGIPGEVTVDQDFINHSIARAEENRARGQVSHGTSIPAGTYVSIDRMGGGENAGGHMNINTYDRFTDDKNAIMSDQELAYNIVFEYFTDYYGMRGGYGHAITMLAANSGMGVGISQVNVQELNVGGQLIRTIGTAYDIMAFSRTKGVRVSRDKFQPVTLEDGRTKLTYDGRDLVFLPRTYFHYVTATTTPGVQPTVARDTLAAYRRTSDAELAVLRERAATTAAIAAATERELNDARTAATAAADRVTNLLATATATQATLTSAESTLSERQAALTAATDLYDELHAANVAAQKAKADLLARHADLLGAQRAAQLAAKYTAIVERGNTPVPVVDGTGTIVDYTEEVPAPVDVVKPADTTPIVIPPVINPPKPVELPENPAKPETPAKPEAPTAPAVTEPAAPVATAPVAAKPVPAPADQPASSAAKTLPATGELSTEALTAMGLSLVLFSLGLAKTRKAD